MNKKNEIMENVIVQGTSMEDLIERIASSVVEGIKPLLQNKDVSPKLLSRRGAADWLGISERTLDKYTNIGSIECVHIGGRVMYKPAELELYMNQGKKKKRGRPQKV